MPLPKETQGDDTTTHREMLPSNRNKGYTRSTFQSNTFCGQQLQFFFLGPHFGPRKFLRFTKPVQGRQFKKGVRPKKLGGPVVPLSSHLRSNQVHKCLSAFLRNQLPKSWGPTYCSKISGQAFKGNFWLTGVPHLVTLGGLIATQIG